MVSWKEEIAIVVGVAVVSNGNAEIGLELSPFEQVGCAVLPEAFV